MKIITHFILVLSLSLGTLSAQQLGSTPIGSTGAFASGLRSADQLQGFTYADKFSDPNSWQAIGYPSRAFVLSGAIRLPEMAGNAVRGVNFVTNYADAQGRIFVAKRQDSGEIRIVKIQAVSIEKGNNACAFDQPVLLSNGEYYVGYQIKAGVGEESQALLFDGKLPAPAEGTFFAVSTEPHDNNQIIKFETGSRFGAVLVFADIDDSSKPLQNVAYPLAVKTLQSKVPANQDVEVEVMVRNLGTQVITSAQSMLQWGVQDPITAQWNQTIDPGKTSTFRVGLKSPAQAGTGTLKFAIKQINGADNVLFAAEEAVAEYVIDGKSDAIARKSILVERFTGEACGNCPRADGPIREVLDYIAQQGAVPCILTHHTFGNDAFQILESLIAGDICGVSWAPGVAIDRRLYGMVEGQASIGFLIGADAVQMKAAVDRALQEPQGIEFTAIKQELADGKLSISVDGNVFNNVDLESVFLSVVITEDRVPAIRQSSGGTDYQHEAVPRQYLTAGLGDKITPVVGTPSTFHWEIQDVAVKETWNAQNLKVVLFAHNSGQNANRAKREVYGSMTLPWGQHLATQEISPENYPVVYTQDGYVLVTGEVTTLEIYSINGALVATSAAQKLAPGMYVVKVLNHFGSFTSKIVVP